uniref:Uncharacterized protein n=1 Tax=Panagrellus redivivus TaxID=6233 RepID=A0A7E4VDI5_PANRE
MLVEATTTPHRACKCVCHNSRSKAPQDVDALRRTATTAGRPKTASALSHLLLAMQAIFGSPRRRRRAAAACFRREWKALPRSVVPLRSASVELLVDGAPLMSQLSLG